MNIVVLVKYVPDATADRRFEPDHTVDRVHVAGLLSELDEYAVEQALQIRENRKGESTEITAVTVGPAGADAALRKALQIGVDKAVYVQDDAIAGSDAIATSLILARTIQKLSDAQPVDLVMTGLASTDAGLGVMPAMLAERLGLPQATLASEVETDNDRVRIHRDTDAATEVVDANMPLILSVTDQSGQVRYPSFKSIMAAKSKPLLVWSLRDIDIDSASVGLDSAYTKVVSISQRPPRTTGEIVSDENGTAAKALADYLTSQKFI